MDMIDIKDIMESSSVVSDPNYYGYNLFNSVMERYEGSNNKELRKCEKYMAEIIDIAKTKGPGYLNKQIPANEKLCSTLKNMFNVKNVKIYWKSGGVNAFTYSSSAFVRSAAKEIRLQSSNATLPIKIHTILYTELITIADLTPREIMAILLHEIGLNFYACPIQTCFDLFNATLSFGLLPAIYYLIKSARMAIDDIGDFFIRNFPKLNNWLSKFNKYSIEVFSILNKTLTFVGFPFVAAIELVRSLKQGGYSFLVNVFKYGDQKGADAFVAKYGYGPDLMSALKKMEFDENLVSGKFAKNNAFGEVVNDIILIEYDLINSLTFNPRPSNYQRAQSTLQKLRKDLDNGDFPPGMKKDLEDQIKELEKMSETIAQINESPNGIHIRQIIYDKISHLTKGHIHFREMLNFYFEDNSF